MTFSIMAAGTVKQARAQIEAAKAYDPADEQFSAVKAFIQKQLAATSTQDFGDYTYGVFVEANGHNGAFAAPYVKLEIRPLTLPVVNVDPEVAA